MGNWLVIDDCLQACIGGFMLKFKFITFLRLQFKDHMVGYGDRMAGQGDCMVDHGAWWWYLGAHRVYHVNKWCSMGDTESSIDYVELSNIKTDNIKMGESLHLVWILLEEEREETQPGYPAQSQWWPFWQRRSSAGCPTRVAPPYKLNCLIISQTHTQQHSETQSQSESQTQSQS